MRWDALRAGPPGEPSPAARAAPMLFEQRAVTRTFDTPTFRGMTFFEVQARSIINRVPDAARVPFRWTINPYRGCSHSCLYCYARKSHTYLDLDSGHDFDSKIVVKVNAPDLVRKELAAPRWCGEHIAMGTNGDCYQRAEGRYRLNRTDVGLAVSVGCADTGLWRELEPGTPSPQRRLEVCAAFTAAGLPCAVLMGPVVPFLSDSPARLEDTVRQIAQAGATSVTPIVLHLRPGAREWFFGWLGEAHPGLMPRYRALYGRGAYAPAAYQQQVAGQVRALARKYGVGRGAPGGRRGRPRRFAPPAERTAAPAAPEPQQLTLL